MRTNTLELARGFLGQDTWFIINIGIALAAFAAWIRSAWTVLYRYAESTCLSTVHIKDDDPLFHDVVLWLNDHVFAQSNFRSVLAVTNKQAYKNLNKNQWAPNINWRPAVGTSSKTDDEPIKLRPFNGSRVFAFRGRWILFSHSSPTASAGLRLQGPGASEAELSDHVKLQTLSLSLDTLRAFLDEARAYSQKLSRSNISVHRPISNVRDMVRWTCITTRPSRSIESVILDAKKKSTLLADLEEYLHPATRQWYADHGIPYRRGYLFSGPPGTGKTSLCSAIAGVFGLDIYVLSLLDPHITESQFLRLFSEVPSQCVVLLEDIDAAGMSVRRPNVAADQESDASKSVDSQTRRAGRPPHSQAQRGPPVDTSGPISLSALLNAIDGVASQEGRILVMTTNAPQDLDPALIRPGRVDMRVQFDLPGRTEMRELFRSMFSDGPGGGREIGTSEGEEEDEKKADIDMDSLSAKFAEALPENKLSLAEVQGFLLQYKRQPKEACERVAEWVKENYS
ncbi:BCS1 and AAA domain-containing protein [Aspergillus mulundensis]|uniref:AAA+ ATPase domain-containing protein n=1 Tax=Aspergillus mulundensis TaxID=1810919 RepID=A0A3D8T335_9EURO|nr:Uncharacterized protein DSM5745_00285 [Aspergillus mulundensis]RDW92963.1 Uncharacterized protein DSM5745_00285 [Aspergillus mulundensis]